MLYETSEAHQEQKIGAGCDKGQDLHAVGRVQQNSVSHV